MSQCLHRDDPDPQGRPVLALEAEALFLVGGLRAWVAAQRRGKEEAPGWREIFALAELPPEAATTFASFMALVRRSMRRALDFRCRTCPQVGADEEALLRLIGALQAGDRLGGIDELADWLRPEAVMPAFDAAGRLAALLAVHEVRLPQIATLPAAAPVLGAEGPHRSLH